MDNQKHVDILKQGVEVWNHWREDHLNEKVVLCEVELRNVNLHNANLQGADLSRADLCGANLCGANLRQVSLEEAYLLETSLKGADLSEANLQKANLTRADLRDTNLCGATLRHASLKWTDLTKTQLTDADITGTFLYGTARDDWMINGIQCEYVFWDEKPNVDDKNQQWEQEHRIPKDRDFRPGEFEELYNSLPTFDYYFEHGFTPIEAVIMDKVVQAINERHTEFELKFDSFQSRGEPHAVFTVLHKDDVEEVKKQVTTDYEARLKVLEGQQDMLMEMLSRAIQEPQLIITSNKKIVGRDYFEPDYS